MPDFAIYIVLPISIFIEMVMMFIVFAYDYFELQQHQSETDLKLVNSQNKATSNLLLGQEKERKRLAIELHDGVGAMISSIKMHFQAVFRDNPLFLQDKTYHKTEKLIQDTYDEVRNISHNLMPLDVLDYGLDQSIQSMCQKLFANSTLKIQCQFFNEHNSLGNEVKLNLFRITQEVMKNIYEHANASFILLQLNVNDNFIHLEIENDGDIFDVSQALEGRGMGLMNIRNRVAYLNGEFNLSSDNKLGTLYSILVPM